MIREARLSDVEQIIPLIMIILKDMELEFLLKYGEEKVTEILREGFRDQTFRYGYKRAVVLEEDNEILGVAFGYMEHEEAIIDLPLTDVFSRMGIDESEKMFHDKEASPEEWYLDSLAVRADQRGKGIGARLLEALPNFAKQQGADRIGLNVDKENPRAKKLYHRVGFETDGLVTISNHLYDHMSLYLD